MYDPNLPRSRVFLPAILSGLLLYASFFPLNFGFLAWIALVPFLALVRANARSRRIYFAAFVGGLFCYVPVLQWIRVAHPAMYGAWIFLSIVCSLFLVMSLALIRKLDRVGVPLWLSAPIGFIAIEYLRSHFPTGYTWMEFFNARHPIGFGWYMIGHTQHDFLHFIQFADLTGVYGVTFLVVLVNAAALSQIRGWVAEPAYTRGGAMRSDRIEPPVLVAGGLLLATLVYGVVWLQHDSFANGPQVVLLQSDIPQDIKNQNGQRMVDDFEKLAGQAVGVSVNEKRPDLVIWPETSFAFGWYDVGPGIDVRSLDYKYQRGYNGSRDILIEYARVWKTPQLYGLGTRQIESDGREWRYNSALLADDRGRPVARYDKIHLVPLGEYVPFPETFPFLKYFTPYGPDVDYNCRPGEMWTRFPLPVGDRTYHFACLICYEDTDASLARQYVRPSSEGIDFLVNISNDGWFDGTAEHEQHLAICRFRAIETRRSVVRAVNMGISAIIDPDGRVVALPGDTWAKSKKVEGIVRGTVPIDTRTTLYARLGIHPGLLRDVAHRKQARVLSSEGD
jgi:apolipoprotein N-acyltransferase